MGKASWAKMTSAGGQANSTGMTPDQISEQRGITTPIFTQCTGCHSMLTFLVKVLETFNLKKKFFSTSCPSAS